MRLYTFVLKELHAEAIAESDILGWAEDKTEVQIMDLLLQMKQKTSELDQMKKQQLRKRVILQMEHLKGALYWVHTIAVAH